MALPPGTAGCRVPPLDSNRVGGSVRADSTGDYSGSGADAASGLWPDPRGGEISLDFGRKGSVPAKN